MITKQALGSLLFGMADILRDKVEDYKSYILSLLFYKRLSDNYQWEIENGKEKFVNDYCREPSVREMDVIAKKMHDFIIPEGCFWDDVRKASIDKKNETLDKAVAAIADQNVDKNGKYILKGIINTVRWNEPAPDGSGGKKLDPEVLSNLINYLGAVDLSNKNVTVDVLGDAYEYLIKRFADENKGGTMAGQFYTPQEVVDIIVRYLKPQEGETVYDPTCGSGGFLLNAAKYVQSNYYEKKSIRLFGQELVWNTWAICNINMILHGLDARIEQGDTIRDPKFKEEDNPLELRTFDKVMANFPFSLENWAQNGEPKKDKKGKTVNKKDGTPQLEYKKEFTDSYNRLVYGIPPYSNGDFAFLQHIIASLDDNGKAGVVCPQGVLFRGQPEKTEEEDGQNRKADVEYLIRRGFLQGIDFKENVNIIDAIVVLPSNLFYGTTIPGAIIFFDKNKPEDRKDKVLMVYAAKKGWYREDANMSVLEPQDVLRISTMLESWGDIDKAKTWMADRKFQLNHQIDADLEYAISEIEKDAEEEIAIKKEKLNKAKSVIQDKKEKGKKPTKGELKTLDTTQKALDKLLADKAAKITAAQDKAAKQRQAIVDVETELLHMFADPELRKRYFAIVDMDDIEENEFNLNIPRYVDTFEPEEQIDLKTAIMDYQKAISAENKVEKELNELLNKLL
ncbi:type I restriction enzyme M protein [Bacteroidales bacterium KHT7]|nr:type I restriction enzyme M protein [Bacteroidales bacterium KHT7]